MTESAKTNGMASEEEARSKPKRPYHKPAVRYERVFKTHAPTCGKAYSQFSCRNNRENS